MNNSPASKGPQETRLPTRLRQMADDIRKLQNEYLRVGKWRFHQDNLGQLIAKNRITGNTTVLAPREEAPPAPGGEGVGFRPGTADYSAIGGDLDEEATADGTYALAIGNGSQASGEEAVALGDWAEAQADSTLAAGSSARARRLGAIALGSGTGANQEGAVALGWNAAAGQPYEGGTGEGAIAIGDDSYTPVDGGMAIGVESFATGIDSAAVGPHAEAYDENAFAAGPRAAAVAPESTALGHRAHTEGEGAVAVGKGAIANYDDSWAMGREAVTTAQKQGLLKADRVRVKPVTAAPAPSFVELYDAEGDVHILGVNDDTVTFDGVPIGGGGGGTVGGIYGTHGIHITDAVTGLITFEYTDMGFNPAAWGFIGKRADDSDQPMDTGYVVNPGQNVGFGFHYTPALGPVVSVDVYSYTSTGGAGEVYQGRYPIAMFTSGGGGATPEVFTFWQEAHLSGFGANVIGGEMVFGLPADFVEDSMEVFINGLAQAPTHGFYIDGTDLKVNPDTFAEWDAVYVRGWIVA